MKGGYAMSPLPNRVDGTPTSVGSPAQPRLRGVLWRLSRRTSTLTKPLAGKRWNPVFALVLHLGRTTGRWYATPVAARRLADGFVISLAFGAQVDWYRNLRAAGGGRIRWRGREYPVGAPETIDLQTGRAAFNPLQRQALRVAGIGGYIRVPDVSRTR
jgi:deazaflavin-dependent oxidoreductase (nitroreductase family)